MHFLKTNTAVRVVVGPFLDATDGVTPETGLTVTNCSCELYYEDDDGTAPHRTSITLTASGGDNDMVHITDDVTGHYDLELTAAQLNFVGRMRLAIIDTDVHCPVFGEYMVLPANVYDSLVLGTDLLQIDVEQLDGDGTAAANLNTACDNYSATRGLAGTALPAADAGAAGGLIKSTAGSDTNTYDGMYAAVGLVYADTSSNLPTILSDLDVDIAAVKGDTEDILADTGTDGVVVASIANNAITAAAIATGAIDADAIAGDAITSDKIADDAIGNEHWNVTSVAGCVLADSSSDAVIADAVWNASYASYGTVGTYGEIAESDSTAIGNIASWDGSNFTALPAVSVGEVQSSALADFFNTDSGTNYAAADAGSVVKQIADNAGGSSLTLGDIADAVWDEARTGHTDTATFGLYLDAQVSTIGGGSLTAADIADAVWDEAIGDHTTPGTTAVAVSDVLTDTGTTIPGVLGSPAGASMSADIAAVKSDTGDILTDTGTTLPGILGSPAGVSLAADIADVKSDTVDIVSDTGTDGVVIAAASIASVADAVWDEAQSGHTDTATFGLYLDAKVSEAGGGSLTAADIADAVWDETVADHSDVGSTGAALAAAGGSGDPWSTALPGAYGAGTAGYLIGTYVDASVSTVDTVVDGIATQIGSAGAGLTAVPWNAAWDAEVQSECADALNAYDPPTNAEMEARTLAAASYATASALATVDTLLDYFAPVLIGTVTGARTGTEVFTYGAVTVTATVDASGNRTVVIS